MKRALQIIIILTMSLAVAVASSTNALGKAENADDVFLKITRAEKHSSANTSNVMAINTPDEALTEPTFAPADDQTVHQTDIKLIWGNGNSGSSTEIYRSLTREGGYQLIYTNPPFYNSDTYIDRDLKPRTTFYYRLRATIDGESTSALSSDIFSATTGSKFYDPHFTATAKPDFNVKLDLGDRSYDDLDYTIYRTQMGSATDVFINQFQMLDSGKTFTMDDTPDPGETYIYRVDATLNDEGYPTAYNVASDTVYVPPYYTLETPTYDFSGLPGEFPCGEQVHIGYHNANTGASTEIYRSRNRNSGYSLIYTDDRGGYSHLDKTTEPRTTYFYKLRAVRDAEVSDYSDVYEIRTGPAFYNPVLETSVTSPDSYRDQKVEVKLTDKSYLDGAYEIYATEKGSTDMTFNREIFASDSGKTYTLIDPAVVPGKTYIYYVSVTLACEGQPIYYDIVKDTISVPDNGPSVMSLTLVNADTDQDAGELKNNDEIDSQPKFNIRADANSKTKSVAFLLNRKSYNENAAPFALFGDNAGNYNPGNLKPGNYTLSATPYSAKMQKGTKGSTVTIQFTVKGTTGEVPTVLSFTLVDPNTDKDVRQLNNNDVIDPAGHYNVRANANNKTGSVQFVLNGKSSRENEVPYALFGDNAGNYNPGNLKPGTYTITATAYSDNNVAGTKGNTLTVSFTVAAPGARIASESQEELTPKINIYPNPVATYSVIEISGKPNAKVLVEVLDQSGNAFKKASDVLNEEGTLSKEIDVSNIPKGIYYCTVTIDNKTVVRRMLIN